MTRRVPAWVTAVVSLGLLYGTHAFGAAPQQDPSLSSGWVSLPADGATTARASVVVVNPTMYSFYVTKASSDVSGSVELRQAAKDAAVEFVTVPAYGSLDMDAEGAYLLLKGLKKPLAAGDKVKLTVLTDGGIELSVEATVKKP